MERAQLIEFDAKFDKNINKFDEKEWAQCLLYMTENFDSMPKPNRVVPVEPDQIQLNNGDENNGLFKTPASVLLAQNNDLRQKLAAYMTLAEERGIEIERMVKWIHEKDKSMVQMSQSAQ